MESHHQILVKSEVIGNDWKSAHFGLGVQPSKDMGISDRLKWSLDFEHANKTFENSIG